jgi:hypothetical protein
VFLRKLFFKTFFLFFLLLANHASASRLSQNKLKFSLSVKFYPCEVKLIKVLATTPKRFWHKFKKIGQRDIFGNLREATYSWNLKSPQFCKVSLPFWIPQKKEHKLIWNTYLQKCIKHELYHHVHFVYAKNRLKNFARTNRVKHINEFRTRLLNRIRIRDKNYDKKTINGRLENTWFIDNFSV